MSRYEELIKELKKERAKLSQTEDGFLKQVGKNILEARSTRGLTQFELSKISGVGRSTITNVETGKQGVPLTILYKIAKSLGLEPHELLSSELDKGEG